VNDSSDIKIWLDDERPSPKEYVHLKTVSECIELLETGKVRHINFDHDLGTKLTGHDLALWIEKRAFEDSNFRVPSYAIQSANIIGSRNIESTMKNARKVCSNPHPNLNCNEIILL